MVAYEFYFHDESEESHFIGILPERRKNQGRITEESIMKWGRYVIGENVDVRQIYFVQVEV